MDNSLVGLCDRSEAMSLGEGAGAGIWRQAGRQAGTVARPSAVLQFWLDLIMRSSGHRQHDPCV